MEKTIKKKNYEYLTFIHSWSVKAVYTYSPFNLKYAYSPFNLKYAYSPFNLKYAYSPFKS